MESLDHKASTFAKLKGTTKLPFLGKILIYTLAITF